ncbi:hypothetical protein O181_068856 [Austropuccinia psidii MF-1]|uniref:Reverse transcriptase/retrotransposon-derived protein RNase H-like domain-containing protein n=1 Tax=Austropuccinia psidii MF-1 TaxID=1389203 RepID=A0A9Q3EVM0_9BASI|nr:hypothetical protein [Austropuccinia psidii MF-1]
MYLFHVSSVEYLGYLVSSEGLKMNQATFQQILNGTPPRNLKALKSFLCFANFYRCFIKNYSKISSITSFLKKYSFFPLNEKALSQFHQLKEAFTTAPILSHFNPSLPTIVETNASNYALGAVLSQVSDSGKHPIAVDSCKHIPAELNYQIHDKELFGNVWALKCWRAFLLSLSSSFEVLTGHSSLKYFMSSKFLTFCQAHWAEYLSEFHFSITYCPGRLATLPDALSRGINQILGQYLWIYFSHRQDNWNSWLPLSQFAYNNSNHSPTKQSLFFAVYGRDPQSDSAHITQNTPSGNLSTKIKSVQKDFKRELEVSINRFKRYADKSRESPPVFNLGDMVWLSSINIKSTRPTKKLSERWLGTLPILKKVITHAYHLKLPSQWKFIHPVFHISLL